MVHLASVERRQCIGNLAVQLRNGSEQRRIVQQRFRPGNKRNAGLLALLLLPPQLFAHWRQHPAANMFGNPTALGQQQIDQPCRQF